MLQWDPNCDLWLSFDIWKPNKLWAAESAKLADKE